MKTPFHQRKTRSDKGTLRLSDFHRFPLTWIGQQGAIRWDTLQRLLSREHGYQDHLLTPQKTNRTIARWKAMTLVKEVTIATWRWIYLTEEGLERVNLPYEEIMPRQIKHVHGINEIRFWIESKYGRDVVIEAERQIRRDKKDGRRPDFVISLDGIEVPVEYERSPKKPREIQEILELLHDEYAGGWIIVTEDTESAYRRLTASYGDAFSIRRIEELGIHP